MTDQKKGKTFQSIVLGRKLPTGRKFICLFVCLYLYLQHGAGTHKPEIKSHMLLPLEEHGASGRKFIYTLISFHKQIPGGDPKVKSRTL